MAKYVVTYVGGAVAETPEEIEASMGQWMGWFGEIGESVAEMGNPFGPSTAVTPDGQAEATGALGGYSILNADSLDEAATLVKGCPVLAVGGRVEIYEAIEM